MSQSIKQERNTHRLDTKVDMPEVDVPEFRGFEEVRKPFWIVNPEKANVPESELSNWRHRLEEIETGALQLAVAARLMQQEFDSPAEAYRRFQLLKKAWNKVTYQTRCVTEGVEVNDDYYVD